ncbi:hypothetical protein P691DRAFT_126986 [Macrolepiota fuliginosa MF-IS2]|uniref:C2H2-type domain-containing protein n=1 Tax=Macrolepiota fuliginosa MF-IS2 TaxID=1400762 RepID=A0A9P5X9R5_9AGAR|nr:hypothetical protein P691DRAFT_126986 [Macrolepiota fuliginosa MF-IS2]
MHNSSVRNFKCNLCRMTIKTASAMVVHLESECPNISHHTMTKHAHEPVQPRIEVLPCKGPCCSVCGCQLLTSNQMPFSFKKLRCLICWKNFGTPRELGVHMKSTPGHQGILFRCAGCEAKFRRIRQMLWETRIKDKHLDKAKSLLLMGYLEV